MRQRHRHKQRNGGHCTRVGTAVTELAICLPIITLLAFGAIETADIIHLKGYLRNISYEGGREAARFNSDTSGVLARMNNLLTAISVENATITIELPGNASDVKELERGALIRISVSAPAGENTVGPLKLFSSRTITAEVIVARE